VNVQFIRAATDEHLWAESYNRKLDDVFAVEGEVASTIADQLNAKLSGTEKKAVSDKPTQNTAAYDALPSAVWRSSTTQYGYDAYQQAANDYIEAVRLDPNSLSPGRGSPSFAVFFTSTELMQTRTPPRR